MPTASSATPTPPTMLLIATITLAPMNSIPAGRGTGLTIAHSGAITARTATTLASPAMVPAV